MNGQPNEKVRRLRELIAEYWGLAYAEGREGRDHDTEDGAAARTLHAINEGLESLRAQYEAEKARADALQEASEPRLKEFHMVNGQLTATFATEHAKELACTYLALCDETQAENYLEMRIHASGGRGVVVTVQREGKPTAHELRRKAEARAEAAEQRVREESWQPIETAPKDGRFVWLGDRFNIRVGMWRPTESRWVDVSFAEARAAVVGLQFVPTHWRSLPMPPQAAIAKDAAEQGKGEG